MDGDFKIASPEWWNAHLTGILEWSMTSGLRVLLIVVLFFVLKQVIGMFVSRAVALAMRRRGNDALVDLNAEKRKNTLTRLLRGVVGVGLGVIAILMIFQEFGFSIGPVLASAGVASLAIGFGAQTLVKDLISGAFIIVERQFCVGDIVRVGDASGLVEEINLRTIVLRDYDGSAHIIPNGQVANVTVLTRDWSRVVVDVGIAYSADIDTACEILKAELEGYASENRELVIEAPEVLGVQDLGESAVLLRGWMKVHPGQQFAATRALRARVKRAFDKAGIEIPFPQRTVWIQNADAPTATRPAAADA